MAALTRSAAGRAPIAPRIWWAWLAVPGTFVAVFLSLFPPIFGPARLLVALLGLVIVVLLSRHPGLALVALTVFLPLQVPLFSYLYRQGAPADILRAAAFAKEALAIAVVAAGVRSLAARRTRLDTLDLAVLGFVAAIVLYLLLPMVLSSDTYPRSVGTRALGFRLNAMFLLVFVGARHAGIGERWTRRFTTTILAMAAFFAALGVYQFLQPSSFHGVLVNDLQIPQYQLFVFQIPAHQIVQLVRWTTADPVRVGSLFVGPFDFADYLVLPAAILLDRLTRRGATVRDAALLALVGGALLATQTRANILAVGVIALLALSPAPRQVLANRLRLVAVVLLALVAFIPNVASSRLGGAEGSAASTQGHLDEIDYGISVLGDAPLGLGLGSAPAVSARTEGTAIVISDNSILQVGNELGIVMMIFFVVLMAWVTVRLVDRSRRDTENRCARAAWLALAGLLIAGQFHHVFQVFAITWPLWAFAGIGLVARPTSDTDASGTAADESITQH